MNQIEYRIRKVMAESDLYNAPAEVAYSVNAESNLVVALELDSLDSVELVMAIEDEFGVLVPDEVAEGFTTIKIAADWLQEAGIPNPEIVGYPEGNDPVIYMDAADVPGSELPRYTVVYEDYLARAGVSVSTVYADLLGATEMANVLKSRSIDASVYKLVKV